MQNAVSGIINKIRKIPFQARRKILQAAAFGFTNFHLENFAEGRIYTGKWKAFCVPGLNCYSCPAAHFSCPVGAMQAVANSRSFDFSFYATGIILAFGVIFGRAVCGFLCPFGLLQELLHLVPIPKFRLQKKWKYLRLIKYVMLGLFVIILPLAVADVTGLGKPWFCEYVCPAGTLEAGIALLLANPFLSNTIGTLFWLKFSILLAVIVLCLFCYRFFCKVLCPLGAIYGLLNKVSFCHLQVDKDRCTGCGACAKVCKMDIDPSVDIRSTECILCGKCTAGCPEGALRLQFTVRDKDSQNIQKNSVN